MLFTSRRKTLSAIALTFVALQLFVPTPPPTVAASASGNVKYQPPKRNLPKRTEATGTRSSDGFKCPTSANSLFIAALAPTTHTGDTIAARPTLYTYFNGTESIEVSLRQVGTLSPVWTQTLPAPTPGFNAIIYPAAAPELAVGKSYQWSVEVVCDATRRYLNKGYTSAKIQRVDEPANFKDGLVKVTTPIDRAQLYATQSLWYDALDTLASASLAAPTDATLRTQVIELLEQGGLVKAAKQAREADRQSSRVIPIAGARSTTKPTHCKGNAADNSANTAATQSDRLRCP